jgi:hypothetical protein
VWKGRVYGKRNESEGEGDRKREREIERFYD